MQHVEHNGCISIDISFGILSDLRKYLDRDDLVTQFDHLIIYALEYCVTILRQEEIIESCILHNLKL